MNARNHFRAESRRSRRFSPRESLTISVAGGSRVPVHGNVRDISPVGACIASDRALESGRAVTLDVRCGYDFLFQAGARVVWQTRSASNRDPFGCLLGMRFTELSPFSRSLILRLADDHPKAPPSAEIPRQARLEDAESDPDLNIVFLEDAMAPQPHPQVAAAAKAKDKEKHFDLLSDPELDALFDAEQDAIDLGAVPERELALSGRLDQFDVTVVLQMLEATRATGILYLEGPHVNGAGGGGEQRFGEIHFDHGRVCGCFSRHGVDDQAPFRWVVADRGRFRFVPAPARANLAGDRSTTALLLEWQLQRDVR